MDVRNNPCGVPAHLMHAKRHARTEGTLVADHPPAIRWTTLLSTVIGKYNLVEHLAMKQHPQGKPAIPMRNKDMRMPLALCWMLCCVNP